MLNLYNFYDKAKTLPLYKEMNRPLKLIDDIPEWGSNITKQDLEPIKHIIMTSPELALYYAVGVMKARWPEAEQYIMKHKWHWDEYQYQFQFGKYENA